MDTYSCPACGGAANATDGCRSCGRAHDPDAAELARVKQEMARLDAQARGSDVSHELTARRARLQSQRTALMRAVAFKLAEESTVRRRGAPRQRRFRTESASNKAASQAADQAASQAASRPADRAAEAANAATAADPATRTAAGAARDATIDDPSDVHNGPTGTSHATRGVTIQPPNRRATATTPAPSPADPDPIAGAETTPRAAQNTLLTLGGILLAIAAIVFAGLVYSSDSGGRAFVLAIATTLCLGVPVLLARRTLTATAETIASVGLLLVLLDGYIAYTSNLAGLASVPRSLFAAILFLLVAGVASAYRLATHLRAPQFAALLAVQPWLPLVALYLEADRVGFSAVFALVAAANLGAVSLFGSELRLLAAADRLRRRGQAAASTGWPRMLRELAWFLFGVSLAAAAGLAIASLVEAGGVGEAVLAGLALVLAAAVGVAGGQLSGRDTARQLGLGAAALAVLAAVVRVNLLVLPEYTLVLTAALAAGIAVAANLLPAHLRAGPQLGSLLGAAFTALVVIGQAMGIAIAVVRAGVTPRIWAADLAGFADRVHTADWQVVAAAVLLAVLAATGTPAQWRVDASVLGGAVAVVALPGAGGLAWWAIPIVAAIASTAATVTALYARTGRSALIRSAGAGTLGLYALATSLPRPEVTAGICALLALVAAVTAIATAGWPGRFGPFADRVADLAAGAAAFTLPIAVGTYAWLGGGSSRVLLPLTLLATAVGVLGAALAQVAAQEPRLASAGGATAAALGAVVFSLTFDAAEAGDVGLAVLLLAAALTTMSSRAFEVSRGHPVEVTTPIGSDRPVDTAADTTIGGTGGSAPVRRRVLRHIDGITLAAALSTGAVIVALARLCAVAVPGIGLVTTTSMVLVTAFAVRLLPVGWRRGPRLGGTAVGGALVTVCAIVAVGEAAGAVAAAMPFWSADLVAWADRAGGWAPFGWQVPASLALAAVAAWVLLPAPAGADVGFVTLSLAGLALPAAAGLAWWSPTLIACALAATAGVGAALVPAGDSSAEATAQAEAIARRRLGLAAVLGAYGAAASVATPGLTGLMLSAVVAAGVLVATIAQLRGAYLVPAIVPGVAAGVALFAVPGAAATLAVSSGTARAGVLSAALGLAVLGVLVVWALRAAGVHWGLVPAEPVASLPAKRPFEREDPRPFELEPQPRGDPTLPAAGVGLAALSVAVAALFDPSDAQVWAAGAALVAALAAAAIPRRREALAVIVGAVGPAALLAAIASAPAWLAALVGPYRTLQQVWQGYAVTPDPQRPGLAMLTLLLLSGVAAAVAITLGGGRYLLASILPPFAALIVLAPAAVGAPAGATAWAALGVAVVTGLGAALSPPTLPAAARLLRSTAAIICAITGAAGVAGSLATRSGTLVALVILVAAAGLAATLGRDPAIRMVAWIVTSAASFALPVTALAAAGRDLRPAAFGILAICAGFSAVAWYLARTRYRRAEAGTVELCGWIGATFALLLTLGSARHAAAVLTIWGLLLGAAALRRDRPAVRRQWLVRAALAAELGACWLLLYSVEVGLPEAYTLPFAAIALLAGALELSRRPELSSWSAYGPALAGGFLPSLALVLVDDAEVWRWVTLFVVSIVVVLLGSWRRRRAPVVTGAAVAILVAVVEMIRLLARGAVAGAILVAVAGAILIGFGALSEKRLRGALRKMS